MSFEWQVAACACVDYRITIHNEDGYYTAEATLVPDGASIVVYDNDGAEAMRALVPLAPELTGLTEVESQLTQWGYRPVNKTAAYQRMMQATTRDEFYAAFPDHKMAAPAIRCRHR